MIRDYQALQKTWFAKGKQRIIKTTVNISMLAFGDADLWKRKYRLE